MPARPEVPNQLALRTLEIALAERDSMLAWSRTCGDDRESSRSFIECSNVANSIANAICPDIAAAIRGTP